MQNSSLSYGKQFISNKDIDVVKRVLKSNFITQGPQVSLFEKKISAKFGSKYTSVFSSGTAALHVLAIALNWGKKDTIVTTPITFLASSNCILYSGAKPDFVDINQISYTIDVNKLEHKLKNLKKTGKKIKAVIAVDYAGNPCDWKSLRFLANKYSFTLINDNCHAIGSKYRNSSKYAIKYADFVTHSYHAVKNITTGEGGAILTNLKSYKDKFDQLRSHGVEKNNKKDVGPWYYEMKKLGFNYRLTDIQCALGINQLESLNFRIRKRRVLAKNYDKAFKNIENFKIPKTLHGRQSSYHLYPLQFNFKKKKISKISFFKKMKKKNINLQVHYIPIYKQPYYKKYNFKKKNYPNSENFYQNVFSIPIYPELKNKDQKFIISEIKKCLLGKNIEK